MQRLGFEIPMLKFRVPAEEWARELTESEQIYPAAIFQEIDWNKKIMVRDGVVRESDCDDFRFDCDGDFCLDTNLSGFDLFLAPGISRGVVRFIKYSKSSLLRIV